MMMRSLCFFLCLFPYSAQAQRCKGTKSFYKGKCRYPEEIAKDKQANRAKAAAKMLRALSTGFTNKTCSTLTARKFIAAFGAPPRKVKEKMRAMVLTKVTRYSANESKASFTVSPMLKGPFFDKTTWYDYGERFGIKIGVDSRTSEVRQIAYLPSARRLYKNAKFKTNIKAFVAQTGIPDEDEALLIIADKSTTPEGQSWVNMRLPVYTPKGRYKTNYLIGFLLDHRKRPTSIFKRKVLELRVICNKLKMVVDSVTDDKGKSVEKFGDFAKGEVVDLP